MEAQDYNHVVTAMIVLGTISEIKDDDDLTALFSVALNNNVDIISISG